MRSSSRVGRIKLKHTTSVVQRQEESTSWQESQLLRDEYNVIFAISSRVNQTLLLFHLGFSELLIKSQRIFGTAF